MKKNSKVLNMIMLIAIVLLVSVLVAIIAYDIWFVVESFSVGSGMVIFVWMLLFAIEIPVVAVIIAITIILCVNLHKRNKKGVK